MRADAPSPVGRPAAPAPTVVWVSCGGCDGCTMSVLGATSPRLEELLAGALTHERVELVHPALALDAGAAYLRQLERAIAGEMDPYVLVVEGSMLDETLAGEGRFSGLGARDGQPIAVGEWVERLAPGAQATMAIGTCATWGGIPAAAGTPTGARGLGAVLGGDYRSRAGLPLINVPGCAPSGDAFVEALQYVVLHLAGMVPLELDDQGRPQWLYTDVVSIAAAGGEASPGPALTTECPVPARGWINRLGGCAAVGGACNGCTRPDFPDATLTRAAAHG